MKKILTFLLVMFLLSPTFSLFGCAKTQTTGNVIRVCNCEDYIDESIFEEFTAETGIEVIYSTYGTNENLYNELVINPNSYDLVVPSEYMIEKLAVEGRIQPLTQKPEYQSYLYDYNNNISPFIKTKLQSIEIDDGKYKNDNLSLYDFMVGYMWGTMGWVYNTENVSEEDVNSWYSPFENSDIYGRITIKDAVRDSYIVGLAMVYEEELRGIVDDNATITEILNRTDRASINKVGNKLSSLKDKIGL
jgi:spermidine/putrescine transport system substrate-binding protein